MKRHLVMDLFRGYQKEVVDGPWNETEKILPNEVRAKVRVKLSDDSETFAYFYRDKAIPLGNSYFWDCATKEPLNNVKEWKMLKE